MKLRIKIGVKKNKQLIIRIISVIFGYNTFLKYDSDRHLDLGYDYNKGSVKMKIIGTEQEIEWVKNTLMNNCARCPYMEPCNQAAQEDQKKHGKISQTCFDYLNDNIEFIISENNI